MRAPERRDCGWPERDPSTRRSSPEPQGRMQTGSVADGEWDWDLMEAAAVPFSDVDPALATSLLQLFQATVRDLLSEDERSALDTIRTPARLDVARVGDSAAIKLTFFGGQTWLEWDGTDDDARSLVRGLAESAAGNVSGDFWIQGEGWRSQTGDRVRRTLVTAPDRRDRVAPGGHRRT